MKTATTNYIQEEQRRFGAVPRLKAEIRPFDFDFGLATGSGTFVNCSCPASGELLLDPGYYTSASWTSHVLQGYMGQCSTVIPSLNSLSHYNSSSLFVRSAARSQDVSSAAWVEMALGAKTELELYFQVKVEFSDYVRAWALDLVGDADASNAYGTDGGSDAYLSYAVDAEFPGRLEEMALAGVIELDEDDIEACGHLIAHRPAFFHDIHGEAHVLTLNNRGRQWIPGHQNFIMADGLWYGKEIRLYTGFRLPSGAEDWVLQYVGRIRDIRDISHSFTGKHQAKIFSNLLIHEVLSQVIGAPGADGTRQPFMAGYYKARADLVESVDAYCGEVTKTGTGSATLVTMGNPTNKEDLEILVEAESSGEITTARVRWSLDNGNSWEKSGLYSVTSISPLRLAEGIYIYFTTGAGTDLVAGDRFAFTAYARRTKYILAGAPFQAITNLFYNGVEVFDATTDPATGEVTMIGPSGFIDARLVKDDNMNPVDIIESILAEVGLDNYLDRVSFGNAKLALADYQVGARFENMAAWKAIQQICVTCLIFFWVDANTIYVSAYTGES
jgi:hypothetical protein